MKISYGKLYISFHLLWVNVTFTLKAKALLFCIATWNQPTFFWTVKTTVNWGILVLQGLCMIQALPRRLLELPTICHRLVKIILLVWWLPFFFMCDLTKYFSIPKNCFLKLLIWNNWSPFHAINNGFPFCMLQ